MLRQHPKEPGLKLPKKLKLQLDENVLKCQNWYNKASRTIYSVCQV